MKLQRLMKTVADAQNFGGKLWRKTLAEKLGGKLLRSVKSLRQTIYDRTKAEVKISASGEISAPAKLLCLSKVERKSSAPIKS